MTNCAQSVGKSNVIYTIFDSFTFSSAQNINPFPYKCMQMMKMNCLLNRRQERRKEKRKSSNANERSKTCRIFAMSCSLFVTENYTSSNVLNTSFAYRFYNQFQINMHITESQP